MEDMRFLLGAPGIGDSGQPHQRVHRLCGWCAGARKFLRHDGCLATVLLSFGRLPDLLQVSSCLFFTHALCSSKIAEAELEAEGLAYGAKLGVAGTGLSLNEVQPIFQTFDAGTCMAFFLACLFRICGFFCSLCCVAPFMSATYPGRFRA